MKKSILFLGLVLFSFTSCKKDKTTSVSAQQEIQVDSQDTIANTTEDLDKQVDFEQEDMNKEYIADFELFTLFDLEGFLNKEVGFVSFSDIYPLSDHVDSLAVPIFKTANTDSLQHIVLDSKYREMFFSRTNISPNDSLFIYDYANDAHLGFLIDNLDVVAILSPYSQIGDEQNNQYDYMIGLQIDKESLKQLTQDYSNAFVSYGSQSPFERGKMQPIVWEKLAQEDFPSQKSRLKEQHDLDALSSGLTTQGYSFTTENTKIYVLDYFLPESPYYIQDRLILILDSKTGKHLREEIISESESRSIATIKVSTDHQEDDGDSSVQYTGKLLKNKPEVVFGFYWASFGCASVEYIPTKSSYIAVNCDNRH